MPILYLEIKERLAEKDQYIKQPMHVLIEVGSRGEAVTKLGDYEPVFTGRTYFKRIIVNNHDIKKPCEEEIL